MSEERQQEHLRATPAKANQTRACLQPGADRHVASLVTCNGLDASVKVLHGSGVSVGAPEHVPIHKEMAVVILEQLVVDVVVGGGAKPNLPEQWVPWVWILAVDQRQPVGVKAAECHVRPDIAVDHVGCDVERHQDHQKRVGLDASGGEHRALAVLRANEGTGGGGGGGQRGERRKRRRRRRRRRTRRGGGGGEGGEGYVSVWMLYIYCKDEGTNGCKTEWA